MPDFLCSGGVLLSAQQPKSQKTGQTAQREPSAAPTDTRCLPAPQSRDVSGTPCVKPVYLNPWEATPPVGKGLLLSRLHSCSHTPSGEPGLGVITDHQKEPWLCGFERSADGDPDPLRPGPFGSSKTTERHKSPRRHGHRIGRDTTNIDNRVIWLSEQITGDYLGLPTATGRYPAPSESSFPLFPWSVRGV